VGKIMLNKSKFKNVLAILIGILPFYIFMIWYRLTHSEGFSTSDMLIFPIVFGGINILLILILNKYLLGNTINEFNKGKGKWYLDIIIGVILTILYFILMYLEQITISHLLPKGKPPSKEVINLMVDLAKNPILLAIWLGPVVWIGVALFEELSRTFFLNCLWRLSDKRYFEILSIIIVSVLMGVVHLYQGIFGIISIGIQGLVIGFFYYKFKRILPLIISHAFYDSTQIIGFVLQVQNIN
jgi:membrane protease YdiL (CAAX protease family)